MYMFLETISVVLVIIELINFYSISADLYFCAS